LINSVKIQPNFAIKIEKLSQFCNQNAPNFKVKFHKIRAFYSS